MSTQALEASQPRISLVSRLADKCRRALREWRVKRLYRNLAQLSEGSNYVRHVRAELADWFAANENDPNRWMADSAERMLQLFSLEGHSGGSYSFAIDLFSRLARFEPWGPLTGAESEWGEAYSGDGTQQNKRCSHVFRDKDGRAYDIEGRIFREPNGCCYTNRESRVTVTFPYTPTREYVDVALPEGDDPQ